MSLAELLRGAGVAVAQDSAHPLALAPAPAWWARLAGEPPVYLSPAPGDDAGVLALAAGEGGGADKALAAARIAFPGAALYRRDDVIGLTVPAAGVSGAGRLDMLAQLVRKAASAAAAPEAAAGDRIAGLRYENDGWTYGLPDPRGELLVAAQALVFTASTRARLPAGLAATLLARLREAGVPVETGAWRFEFPRAMLARVEAVPGQLILHTVFGGRVQLAAADDTARHLAVLARNGYPT